MKIKLLIIVVVVLILVGIAYSQPIPIAIRLFRDLFDTPTTYTDHAAKLLVVNAGETALEFSGVTLEGGSDTQVIYNNSGVLTGDSTFTWVDGALSSGANTDVTSTFGRWKVGYDGLNSDLATLSHYDRMAWNTWALAQDSSINTYLSGDKIYMRLTDGVSYFRLYDSAGDERFHIVGDTAWCLGGNLGSERVFFRQSGTNPTQLNMTTPYSNLELNVDGSINATSMTLTNLTISDTVEAGTLSLNVGSGGFIELELSEDGLELELSEDLVALELAGAGNQVVYLNGDGDLTYEAGFEYDPDTNTLTAVNTTVSGVLSYSGSGAINGEKINIVAKTAAYTATATDDVITCGAGNETFTIDLPSPLTGKTYFIKNVGSGVVTVDADTTGSTTIDGETTQILNQYDCIMVVSDASVYWII